MKTRSISLLSDLLEGRYLGAYRPIRALHSGVEMGILNPLVLQSLVINDNTVSIESKDV